MKSAGRSRIVSAVARLVAVLLTLGLLLTVPLELLWGASGRVTLTTVVVGVVLLIAVAVVGAWADGDLRFTKGERE